MASAPTCDSWLESHAHFEVQNRAQFAGRVSTSLRLNWLHTHGRLKLQVLCLICFCTDSATYQVYTDQGMHMLRACKGAPTAIAALCVESAYSSVCPNPSDKRVTRSSRSGAN